MRPCKIELNYLCLLARNSAHKTQIILVFVQMYTIKVFSSKPLFYYKFNEVFLNTSYTINITHCKQFIEHELIWWYYFISVPIKYFLLFWRLDGCLWLQFN